MLDELIKILKVGSYKFTNKNWLIVQNTTRYATLTASKKLPQAVQAMGVFGRSRRKDREREAFNILEWGLSHKHTVRTRLVQLLNLQQTSVFHNKFTLFRCNFIAEYIMFGIFVGRPADTEEQL